MATPSRSPRYTTQDFHAREDPSRSTSYGGSDGNMDGKSLHAIDQDLGYDDIHLTPQGKAVTSPRQAIGARFLSSLSNAQSNAGGAGGALTRSRSMLHSRAKSLAAYVPRMSSGAPEQTNSSPPAQSNRLFGDLFSGESAPVRMGLGPSVPEEDEEVDDFPEYKSGFTERPSHSRRISHSPSKSANRRSIGGATTKQGWFGRKSMVPGPAVAEHDEWVDFNINNALFPQGQVDPLSPHAFNDLLLNATDLLQRMQVAYKEKTDYIANIRPEMDVQKEEVEESETRARHLKMQLEDMSRKHAEQEQAMQEVALQLAHEKMKVQEAHDAMARNSHHDYLDNDETPRRNRKRGSHDNASDSGFESDMESIISSRAETPIDPPALVLMPDCASTLSRASSVSGRSPARSSALEAKRKGGDGLGGNALREENKALRRQLETMHMSLQGCIDLVST